jgi:hypothetical protein
LSKEGRHRGPSCRGLAPPSAAPGAQLPVTSAAVGREEHDGAVDYLIMAAQEAAGSQDVGWWEVLGALSPLATLLAATIAGTIAWQALKQRSLADRRAEWWGRAQWALNAALSGDPALKETGLGILGILATSSLATNEEIEILGVAAVQPLAEASRPSVLPERGPGQPEHGPKGAEQRPGQPEHGPGQPERGQRQPEHGPREPEHQDWPAGVQDRIVRRAATLRVVADRRLGRRTEEWVRRLAAGD